MTNTQLTRRKKLRKILLEAQTSYVFPEPRVIST